MVGTGTSMQYDDGQECESNHIEESGQWLGWMMEKKCLFTHATNIE